MSLTEEEHDILSGSQGPVMRKALETIVRFGDVFGALRLVEMTHPIHMAISMGMNVFDTVYAMMDEIIDAGLTTTRTFTVAPRPIDFENVPVSFFEELILSELIYGRQDEFEAQLEKTGLASKDAFTCTGYLNESGQNLAEGDITAWSESSAVVYVNSVIGARTNRNPAIIDLLCGLIGKTPEFGLLLDEGRRANWFVELKCSDLPDAQVLGYAVGMKIGGGIPYLAGLDGFFSGGHQPEVRDYLKDMGAVATSVGEVDLFHAENITPEARKLSRRLLKSDCRVYTIDDEEVSRVRALLSPAGQELDSPPAVCFIGCPHLSYGQIRGWADRIEKGLAKHQRVEVAVPTVFSTSPEVLHKVSRNPELAGRLEHMNIRLSAVCPLMQLSNPISEKRSLITNSSKLRAHTNCRYFSDSDLQELITGATK